MKVSFIIGETKGTGEVITWTSDQYGCPFALIKIGNQLKSLRYDHLILIEEQNPVNPQHFGMDRFEPPRPFREDINTYVGNGTLPIGKYVGGSNGYPDSGSAASRGGRE